jgi:hypothetical protein
VQKVTYVLFFFQIVSEEQAQRLLHREQALGEEAHKALFAASLSLSLFSPPLLTTTADKAHHNVDTQR